MLSRLDEIRLLSQCALADNRDAFGRLVEAYQPRVRRFLLNLTMGDEMLTDDLSQETFIKAYVGIRSFKGLSSFGPTTSSIATAADIARSMSRTSPVWVMSARQPMTPSTHR